MPDPNQNNNNQNSTSPTVTDVSSADQPIVLPADHPISSPLPPVAPLPDPVVTPMPITTPQADSLTPTQESTPVNITQPSAEVPSFLGTVDLPPLAPEFQNVTENVTTDEKPETSNVQETNSDSLIGDSSKTGSAAPLPDLPITTGSPKKKFGGGKIIATILGLFLLVGGIAGGVLLTQQNQNLSEKAGGIDYQVDPTNCGGAGNQCGAGQGCVNGQCVAVNTQTDPKNCGQAGFQCASGAQCVNGQCTGDAQYNTDPNNCGGPGRNCGTLSCVNGQCVTSPNNTCSKDADCSSGQTCQSGKCTGTGTINCGGVQCNPNNCHCTGGDACTGHECVTDTYITNVCTSEGRSWCDNMNGNGKTCCAKGYHCATTMDGCAPNTTSTNPPGSNPPGTPPTTPTAQCQNIKAYTSTFTLLTDTQLAALTPNTVVNFCVLGTASAGTFDKAKFTINTVAQAETTTKRPGSNDFCQSYTIPSSVTTFNVTAQIHHATLGWK